MNQYYTQQNPSMMKTLLPLLVMTTAFSLLRPSLSDQPTQDLINKICRQTADSAFCSGILQRNLVSPNTDLAGLTRLTLSLSRSFAEDTLGFVQKSEATETRPSVKQAYAGCEDNYKKVAGFMEVASNDANVGNYKTMVALLKQCSGPIILCQNAIGRIVHQMLDKNRLMRVFLTMGLYEGSLLL